MNDSTGADNQHNARPTAPTESFAKDPSYVKQRREIIRNFHPDHGGDSSTFIAKLQELDQQWQAQVNAARRPTQEASSSDHWDRARDIARRHTDKDGHLDPGAAAAATIVATTPFARRMKRKLRTTTRNGVRTLRTRLPKGMPGAVRYAQTSTTPQARTTRPNDRETEPPSKTKKHNK